VNQNCRNCIFWRIREGVTAGECHKNKESAFVKGGRQGVKAVTLPSFTCDKWEAGK
jgi:hypothetical protein